MKNIRNRINTVVEEVSLVVHGDRVIIELIVNYVINC